MKAILEFNLDDTDDATSHRAAVKASDMAIVLFEIVFNLRKQIEWHYDGMDKDEYKKLGPWDGVEEAMKRIHELLDQHSIDINELIR